jgi:isoleucyl-tRNA synthetase
MIELNKTINWKPAATGTGRFGNWLENLVDWNLSRSRYWGIPIPIWTSEDRAEQICIGSAEQLKAEIDKSVAAGLMEKNPLADFTPGDFSKENYNTFDFHRPFADEIVLVSETGQPMQREADLIDVWFDSGSMPYAQWHYPFENKELFEKNYPADFIAEGVDQTRGWFFTLHAIASVLFDSVAFKNVISNGLVLDKAGNKMSKRLGNAADPFTTLDKYGADATRWYMITNAQPWDNLKFDLDGIAEVQRKFFGTLYNTYSFFSLYANIDGFTYKEDEIPLAERPEIDRWVLSELNTLVKEVTDNLDGYEPTKAGRAIQHFVTENLSNWYVRLCRRRFWKGEYAHDKIAAFQTLYTCLDTVSKLMAPIAPFFSDRLYLDLNKVSGKESFDSVHLSEFPVYEESKSITELEEKMGLAQTVTSAVLSIRNKERLKVRQPLQKIMVAALNAKMKAQLEAIGDLILSEVNVKELEILTDTGILVKEIKPNFKALGPRFGKQMKAIAAVVNQLGPDAIAEMEANGTLDIEVDSATVTLNASDVEIKAKDIPGWLVTNLNNVTVALDVTMTEALQEEGIARELVNRIQNIRKDKGFEVTDSIRLVVGKQKSIEKAIESNKNYICNETLAKELEMVEGVVEEGTTVAFDDVETTVAVFKLN